MTHLRQIMLEERERRNYAPGTIRFYILPSNTSLGTSVVPLTGSGRNISAHTGLPCSRSGSWLRTTLPGRQVLTSQ